MKNIARIWVGTLLFVLAATGGVVAGAQSVSATGKASGADVLSEAQAFPYEQMAARKMPNGGESRSIVQGVLKTGEVVGLHESTQPVGSVPNPAHRIEHSEFIVVSEGTLEFEHDGKADRVGPGGVIYVALGTMHRVRNVGNVPAKYVVIAIGGDTKR